MFSLNVPVPPAIDRIASDLHPTLASFDRIRERHTLVCKRFAVDDVAPPGGPDPSRDRAVAVLRERLRPLLRGTDPFPVRVAGVDAFREPTRGPGPVVYLAVESRTLERLHRRLCGVFDPVEGIEGDGYVPHVTLARGGDDAALRRALAADIEPVAWEVTELELYDPEFREPAATLRL